MKTRILKVSFGKSGSGSVNTKISIPKKHLDEMGVSPDEREVLMSYDEEKKIITIQKK